jgi:hypothetical protein
VTPVREKLMDDFIFIERLSEHSPADSAPLFEGGEGMWRLATSVIGRGGEN